MFRLQLTQSILEINTIVVLWFIMIAAKTALLLTPFFLILAHGMWEAAGSFCFSLLAAWNLTIPGLFVLCHHSLLESRPRLGGAIDGNTLLLVFSVLT